MIGVDVLPKQRDLAAAGARESRDLVKNGAGRPRGLGAAGVRHDAKRAELVAAFLHGDEGRNAAPTNGVESGRRKLRELVLGGEVGVHDPGTDARLAQKPRQAMIALWADDDIDRRLAAQDLRPLRLGDTAGDDQHRRPAHLAALFLEFAQLAELGKDFLRRAFADMASVENDEVGVLDPRGLGISRLAGEVAHPLGIIDVHLASELLDEPPRIRIPRGTCHPISAFKHNRFGQLGAPEGSTSYVGAFRSRGNSRRAIRRVRGEYTILYCYFGSSQLLAHYDGRDARPVGATIIAGA